MKEKEILKINKHEIIISTKIIENLNFIDVYVHLIHNLENVKGIMRGTTRYNGKEVVIYKDTEYSWEVLLPSVEVEVEKFIFSQI